MLITQCLYNYCWCTLCVHVRGIVLDKWAGCLQWECKFIKICHVKLQYQFLGNRTYLTILSLSVLSAILLHVLFLCCLYITIAITTLVILLYVTTILLDILPLFSTSVTTIYYYIVTIYCYYITTVLSAILLLAILVSELIFYKIILENRNYRFEYLTS